ncbi:MAG: adenylate kinase [Candidatus Campbellbacteria bacterium]
MKYNTIVILGKPGSGKGTQAELLSQKAGFPVFSASGRLRELAKSHPDIGQEILDDMNQGVLVPHWIVSYLWISEMVKLGHEGGIIFDGAVRKFEEAKLFHEVMTWLARPYAVVYLTISNEELHDRLSKRAGIEGRADDDGDVIMKRLTEYDENTKDSLAFFREQGTLMEVNGEGTREEIHERIMQAVA